MTGNEFIPERPFSETGKLGESPSTSKHPENSISAPDSPSPDDVDSNDVDSNDVDSNDVDSNDVDFADLDSNHIDSVVCESTTPPGNSDAACDNISGNAGAKSDRLGWSDLGWADLEEPPPFILPQMTAAPTAESSNQPDTPASSEQAGDQPSASVEPGDPKPARKRSSRHRGPTVVQRLTQLLCLLTFMLAAMHLVPRIAEEIQYSLTRGQQRAEHEIAGEALKDMPLRQLSQAYQLISKRVGPSVVHIDTSLSDAHATAVSRNLAGPNTYPSRGQGSGVVVDGEGYILTNRHVILGSDEIRVKLSDGRSVSALVVGVDELTDLAVLKVDAGTLTPIDWGDSESLQVGALVWALGSPFGLERSITSGILSAKHRSAKVGRHHQDFLQTDAAVNPGNSGGPLVDSQGTLIGINTAIVGDTYQGISFAVPSQVAKNVFQRIKASGHVRRGWLGVALRDMTQEHADRLKLPAETRGALVIDYATGSSPAKRAGVRIGDVIVRWNEHTIRSMSNLILVIARTDVGTTAEMEVLRRGRRVTLKVAVAERPPERNPVLVR